MGHMSNKIILYRILFASTFFLFSGCDDTIAPVNARQNPQEQELRWSSCDPSILGRDSIKDIKVGDMFNQLGKRLTCTNIKVPMDHHHPEKGTISIALIRVAATGSQQRKGAILFNPGGPGGDGLLLAPAFAWLGTPKAANETNNASWHKLAEQYDFIGFSPRGTGASSTLSCISNEFNRPISDLTDDRSSVNIENAAYNDKLAAQTCQKNPLTPYINTEQTVHDIELIRKVLGEAKLNYLGYSYGTWLGLWYASLYPKTVGRMVLDSNTDFTKTFDDLLTSYVAGHQRAFEQVLLPYAARHPEIFNLGTSPHQVQQHFDALHGPLKAAVRSVLLSSLRNSAEADRGLAALMAAQAISPLINQDTLGEQQILNQISTVVFSSASELNQLAHEVAREFIYGYFFLKSLPPQPFESLKIDPSEATHIAVSCNDTPAHIDPQFWIKKGEEFSVRYPLMGGRVTQNPCKYWGGPTTLKPSVNDAKAVPFLMVQSEFDAPTPLEGAEQTFAALPKAKMVFVKDEYSHGVFPYETACVDEPIVSYLSGANIDSFPRKTVCAAKPLTYDTLQTKNQQANRNNYTKSTPMLSNEIVKFIHKIIERNSLGSATKSSSVADPSP